MTTPLQLLARGAPIKVICRELTLSEGTVKTHVTAIYRAFNASNRTEALLAARRHRWSELQRRPGRKLCWLRVQVIS